MNIWVWGTLIYAAKKVLANGVIWLGKEAVMRTERDHAIWDHYVKSDHSSESVLDCHEGGCKVFTSYAS
jgi:hypothetical protein